MIRTVYRWLIQIIEILSIIGISLVVLFTAYEVGMRQLFGRPTIWTNEITSYLLVWLGLLGIIYAFDKNTHVSVDLIYKYLPLKVQRFANVLVDLLMFGFSVIVCLYGYKYWWLAFSRGWRHIGMLDMPMSYTRIALPIVGVLMVFQIGLAVFEHIRRLITGDNQKP